MRKFLLMGIIGVALISAGFAGKLPTPVEGIYSLKLKTLTVFDFREIPLNGKLAELTDSKPDFLTVEGIDYEKASDYKFGSFRLGNNEQKVWFLMVQSSSGNWDNLYLDQNLDDTIIKKEEIKSFQPSQYKENGYKVLSYINMIPVSLKISYKGITKEYERNLYFFISPRTFSKKNENHLAVVAFSASFLEGEMKVSTGKEYKLYKFAIVDGDSNGCFNDYGKDLLFINLKQDGGFHKNEYQKLTEFFDSTGNKKIIRQLRLNLLPFCLQMGVSDVTGDFNLAQLEPPGNTDDNPKPEDIQKLGPEDNDQQQSEQSTSPQ